MEKIQLNSVYFIIVIQYNMQNINKLFSFNNYKYRLLSYSIIYSYCITIDYTLLSRSHTRRLGRDHCTYIVIINIK